MSTPQTEDRGYLHHGRGTQGPFRTESVRVRNEFGDRWQAFYCGKWRRVHIQVRETYITHLGERIAIQIEGV